MVFNIKGNHYRLIVKINYDISNYMDSLYRTHAEYNKIDAKTNLIMTIKAIKTKKDYQQALARLEIIFDAKKAYLR
jgi:hypothetical protein